jgi:ABC-2 type transport system permease protein
VTRVLAIARRDFAAYFLGPAGYIITALFLLFTALLFLHGFEPGAASTMRAVFGTGTWLLLFIGPAITMRMVSEESRSGTMEMLMTSPSREVEIILGKFAAAVAFLTVMLVPTLAFVAALELHGRPDYGELACGYAGLVLAGSAYVASGLFCSTLTSSQAVAFLLALFFWLALGVGTKFAAQQAADPWNRLAVLLDPDLRLRDFVIGLIDTANVAYFLAFTAVFLFAAVWSLESRRWR